ncbi:MAG: hypothetical protein J6O73_05415 [Lachnospiraceae bacterium]|nr:hypothetical protein [Lachnospiraceae bacterium]
MNLSVFLEKISDIKGYAIASLTDEYIVDTWPMERYSLAGKEDKLLELHVFNKEIEERLIRTGISKGFKYRRTVDSGKDFFDEYHYIDIDTKKTVELGNGDVVTTGGGRFHLPLEVKEGVMLKIRYYLDKYEDTGHVKLSDWRMVDFLATERVGD